MLEKQQTFATAAWNRQGKVTRREHFLLEMDAVIAWQRWLKRIAPYYLRGNMGRQPHDLERMLRIYFMQQWFSLTAPQAAEADIKQLWGFDKTRYRGIAKNLARAQTMFALANLYLLRHQLMPAGHSCVL